MAIRVQCVCADCTDPDRLARFWAEVLGWRRTFDDDEVVLEEPAR